MVLSRSKEKKIPVKSGACVHLFFIFSLLAPASFVTVLGLEIQPLHGAAGPCCTQKQPEGLLHQPLALLIPCPLLRTSIDTSHLCSSTLHQCRRGRNISLRSDKLLVPNVYMKLWSHQT